MNEARPCRLCGRPKSEHGQPRFFDSEEEAANSLPFECNEVWRDPGSFSVASPARDEVVVECEECWALVRVGRQDRHAAWHEQMKWHTSAIGNVFGGLL